MVRTKAKELAAAAVFFALAATTGLARGQTYQPAQTDGTSGTTGTAGGDMFLENTLLITSSPVVAAQIATGGTGGDGSTGFGGAGGSATSTYTYSDVSGVDIQLLLQAFGGFGGYSGNGLGSDGGTASIGGTVAGSGNVTLGTSLTPCEADGGDGGNPGGNGGIAYVGDVTAHSTSGFDASAYVRALGGYGGTSGGGASTAVTGTVSAVTSGSGSATAWASFGGGGSGALGTTGLVGATEELSNAVDATTGTSGVIYLTQIVSGGAGGNITGTGNTGGEGGTGESTLNATKSVLNLVIEADAYGGSAGTSDASEASGGVAMASATAYNETGAATATATATGGSNYTIGLHSGVASAYVNATAYGITYINYGSRTDGRAMSLTVTPATSLGANLSLMALGVGATTASNATFTQTSGTLALSEATLSGLTVGSTSGYTGTYLLEGGSVSSTNTLIDVTGTLTQSGGTTSLGNLTLNGMMTVSPTATPNTTTTVLTSLTVAGGASPTGVLDLGNNSLIIQGGGSAGRTAVAALVAYARDGGAWDREGITSSTAKAAYAGAGYDLETLGVALNSELLFPFSTFEGVSVSPNDVLAKFTYGGDADLSGTINSNDYFLIDRGYGNHYTGWVNGDFNYDGTVNGNDYFIIDSTFIDQSGALAAPEVLEHAAMFGPSYLSEFTPAQLAEIGVPEPASLALLGAGALALFERRYRGRKS